MARANGDGSIYQSKDGSGWIATLELAPKADGKRVRRRRRAPTKAKARDLLRQMQKEFASAGHLGDSQRLVSETIETYLEVREGKSLASKTIELERWRAGLVARGLGKKKVRSLSVADCDSFLQSAAAGDLSSTGMANRGRIGTNQLRRVRSFLVRALRNDMRLGFVTRNVAELSEVPNSDVKTRPRRALSQKELACLRSEAVGLVAVLVELLGRYGLRPAESRALTWEALNLNSRLLSVGPRLNRNNERIGPKTRAADRSLRIDAETIEILKEWKSEQDKHRMSIGRAWRGFDLIVTTEIGEPLDYWLVSQQLAVLCRKVDVSPTVSPYELRHTAISFQAGQGHSAWAIADWAGTSERMIADVYRHKLMGTSPLGPAI